jgi:hypothetical protein
MRETIPTGERGGMTAKLIRLLLVTVVAMILIHSFTQNIAVGEIERSGARSMKALNKGLITYATMWGGYQKSLLAGHAQTGKCSCPNFSKEIPSGAGITNFRANHFQPAASGRTRRGVSPRGMTQYNFDLDSGIPTV